MNPGSKVSNFSGDTFVPRFNAYADGSRIANHLVWIVLRDYMANRPYTIPV